MSSSVDTAIERPDRTKPLPKGLFFPLAATLMLVIAFVGFSKTLWLRPFFEPNDMSSRLGLPSLPLHLFAHGLVLSLWFFIVCIQSWLVALRKLRMHRQLGYAGLIVGAAVFVSGVVAVVLLIPRSLADGRDFSAFSGIVAGDFVDLTAFAVFVGLAAYWRQHPGTHKRLMLLASWIILGPAFVPSPNRPFGGFLLQLIPDWLNIDLFILKNIAIVLALVAYDLLSERRILKVTLIAGLAVVALEPLYRVMRATGFSEAFTRWLA
jgi:hypothetical protein